MNTKTYATCERFAGMTAEEIREICAEAANHPGRLQGMTEADAYWTLINDDLWDSVYDVTADELEIFPELAGIGAVTCYADDLGFCYVSRHATLDEAEVASGERYAIDEAE